MNRLAPLIRRPALAATIAFEAAPEPAVSTLLDDIRFFATVWAGGLVFFATLFA